MDRMGEDWFLINESEKLGTISCLDLWHDNTGAKAECFCDSIIIYDLHHKHCYFFVVNDWLTLSFKRFPQVTVFPTPISEIMSSSRIFRDYFKAGFHLSHLWLDTIVRHPRDPVSRVDRLGVILCFILVSTAVSIAIITLHYGNVEEDDFSYSVSWLMVEVSVYSCIIAGAIACLLMHMFRRVYKIILYSERLDEISHERKVSQVSWKEHYFSLPSTLEGNDNNHIPYGKRHSHLLISNQQERNLKETINLTLMPKLLVPVQLEGDKSNVIVNKVWLLATWATVIVISLVCIITSLYLSQITPPIKTEKWYTIIALSAIIHSLLILPIKITLVSALLSIAFTRIIRKDIYNFDPWIGRQVEKFGMARYLANLVYLRSLEVYKPLHEDQTNAHLRTLMSGVYRVDNTTDYLNYIHYHCVNVLFKYIWYDWKLISHGSELNFFRKDWISDGVSRMVGNVYLRQFRVDPHYCKQSVNLTTNCSAPFSWWAEDTRDYKNFWKTEDEKDELAGFQLLSDWSFTGPSNDSNFFYDGITGQSYTSGGYTWDLGASDEEMDSSLDRLMEEGWIGHYTRAVIAQVKSYNVNTRLFTETALVTEQTITGQILSTVVVNSVDINLKMDWWLTLFVFLAFMLCVRIYVMTNFVGLMGLFKNWRRPYEVLMTVIALLVLLYMLLHYLTVPQYVREYQMHSEDLQFFDFYKTAHYSFTARALLCVLLILNIIRFFSLWKFGKTVFRFFITIVLSTKHLIWLTVICVLFQLLLFRVVGYLFLIFIDVVYNPNLFYRSNYSYFTVCEEMIGFKVVCFLVCFISVIIMMLFVVVFTHKYKSARDKYIRDWNVDNYVCPR